MSGDLAQSGSFGWMWLVAVLGAALIGAIGKWAVAKIRSQPSPVQLPTGETLDARNSGNLARMLADLYGKYTNLEDVNQTLSADNGLLVDEVDTLRKGVENGTIPPLHALDPRLAHLFTASPEGD